jgi:hypothetical protein
LVTKIVDSHFRYFAVSGSMAFKRNTRIKEDGQVTHCVKRLIGITVEASQGIPKDFFCCHARDQT